MEIKPGMTINIITNIDYRKEIIESNNSIVYDVTGDKIVIAQTEPPLSRTRINKEIYATYLKKEEGKPVRYGFPAVIGEFLKNYELASQEKTQAVVLIRRGIHEPYNIRMFYRLEPRNNCGIDIFVNGVRVNILDISIGGSSFSHNKVDHFREKEEKKIILVIGERSFQIESKIVRVWKPESEKVKKNLEHVSIQFIDMNGHIKNELSKVLREIESNLRCKEIDL